MISNTRYRFEISFLRKFVNMSLKNTQQAIRIIKRKEDAMQQFDHGQDNEDIILSR